MLMERGAFVLIERGGRHGSAQFPSIDVLDAATEVTGSIATIPDAVLAKSHSRECPRCSWSAGTSWVSL